MPQDRSNEDTFVTVAKHEALQPTELTWAQDPKHQHRATPGTWAWQGEGLKVPACPPPPTSPFFALSVSSSKFRMAMFGWCCLGYMPESQLHRSLGNQASDIFPLLQWKGTCPTKTYEVGNSQPERGVPDATEQKNDQHDFNSYFSWSWENWSAEFSQGGEGKAKKWRDRQNPDDIMEASESRCAWDFLTKQDTDLFV